MNARFRGRVAWLSLASGCVWGLIGYWLASDTNMRAGAFPALTVSPGIGLMMGFLAIRFDPQHFSARVVYALVAVYVASAIFILTVNMWVRFFAFEGSPLALQPSAPSIVSMVIWALPGAIYMLTISGWALILWPVSFVNHLLIWQRSGKERLQTLGLVTAASRPLRRS